MILFNADYTEPRALQDRGRELSIERLNLKVKLS